MSTYQALDYLRLSDKEKETGKKKENESDSIANQRRIIQDFVKENPDIELVGEKIDDGYSGIVFDRPGFKEMMQLIEEGKINCVIVKDLSRLGREFSETGRYLQRIFPAYGVRFIAINDNIDTLRGDVSGDLTVSFKSILNDAYCHDISIKTRSALTSKRENGEFVGACPVYGYAKSPDNKNQLVIDEPAAAVVRDIFHQKLEGVSAARIAEQLNQLGVLSPMEYKREHGIPHPTGGYADKADCKWSATTVIRILKDETYTGVLIQGKQGTANYKVKTMMQKQEHEWFRTENAHEHIIRKHDFDLVQRLLNLDTRTAPGEDKVYLFSGILVCGCCGARMTRKTVPYKDQKYYYYFCPAGKKNKCSAPMVKESELVDCILKSLKAHISNIVSLDELLNACGASVLNKTLIKQHRTQIEQNEEKIKANRGYKSTLYENLVSGLLTKADYASLKSKYDTAIQRLENANEALELEMEALQNNTSDRLRWMAHFKRFEQLDELDRIAVIQLISSITVQGKTEIGITFNYQSEYEQAVDMMAGNNWKEAV